MTLYGDGTALQMKKVVDLSVNSEIGTHDE
jgi:hypothetical protein